MKRKIDMDRIGMGIGASGGGNVSAKGGYFCTRCSFLRTSKPKFRVPAGGGRTTEPRWTERRAAAPRLPTLAVGDITSWVRSTGGINSNPMQLQR